MHTKRLQLRSKKWLLSVLAACGLFLHGIAQNGVAINTTGASPDASAILDLSNTASKGFLPPKFSSTSVVSSPATGLVIYQTGAPAGIYCNIGTSASPNWILLSSSTGTVTSVGLSMPSGFTVSNSPVTSSGTLAVTTSLNGLVYGNGSGFSNATVSAPLTYSAGTLGITQAGSTTSGFLSSADWNTFNNKLSGNQSITLSGDATGTGTTLIPLTLATVNSNVGTYNTVTVNGKGLVTSASNTSYQIPLNGTGYVKQSGATTSYISQIPLATDVTGILPVANGGTGVATTSANYIFAGPTTGNGAPSFRPVAASDLPTNSNAYIQNSIASAQNAGFNINGSAIIGGNASIGGTTSTIAIPKFSTAGSVIYSSTTGGVLAATTAGTSGQVLTSAGAGAPTWTTTLPIANGGTNTNTIGSAGSVIYSNGTQQASTAVGTSGQVLTSNGSGAPTWTSPGALTTLGQSSTTTYGTGTVNTSLYSSTSPGTVVSYTFTLTNTSTVLISTYGGGYSNSSSGYSSTSVLKVMIDNVATSDSYFFTGYWDDYFGYYPPSSWSFSTSPSATLAAGSHTIKVVTYAYSGTSAGATISGSSTTNAPYRAALTVTVLKP